MRFVLFLTPLLVYAQSAGIDWVTQVRNKPVFDVRTYNFPLRSPSGALTASSPATVTLAPVPLGVNGTDSGHWLYIPTCSGGAQAVLITGGTAVSGASTGTITFTPTNSCNAGWTLQSADGGIPEALQAAATLGFGTVQAPPGTITLHSDFIVPSDVTFKGSGRGVTVLLVATGAFDGGAQFKAYGLTPSGVVIAAPVGGSKAAMESFTLDMNGANQPSAPNGSYGIELVNHSYGRISNVEVNNCPILTALNTCLPIGVNGTSTNNIVEDSFIFNQVCATSSQGAGGIIVGGTSNRILHNYVSNGCNSAYVTGGTDTIFQGNVFELAGSTMVAAAQAFAADNAVGTRFIGNNCLGNGTGPACFASNTDAASPDTQDTVFEGNIARNCGQGFQIQSTTATSRRVQIIGGAVASCTTPLSITGTIDRITISGVTGLTLGHSDARVSVTLVNGANENIDISDGGFLRLSGPSGAFSVGGFNGGIDGRAITILNASTQQMTINHGDAGSSAANRICSPTGGNVVLRAGDSLASFRYSIIDSCWWIESTN